VYLYFVLWANDADLRGKYSLFTAEVGKYKREVGKYKRLVAMYYL
jgi:hypothetical protein